MYTNLMKNKKMVMYKIDRRGKGGVQKSYTRKLQSFFINIITYALLLV